MSIQQAVSATSQKSPDTQTAAQHALHKTNIFSIHNVARLYKYPATFFFKDPIVVLTLMTYNSLMVAFIDLKKGKGSLYSITERRILELTLVLGSQPAGEVSHKPAGRQPLLSARPAVTPATLKRAATNFAAW